LNNAQDQDSQADDGNKYAGSFHFYEFDANVK